MLDAMVPGFAAPGSLNLKAPMRLVFAYVPNGIVLKDWTPKTTGKDYNSPHPGNRLKLFEKTFSSLEFDSHTGNALGDGPGDHARAGASFLTGVHCRKTAGADIRGGVSVDQIAAANLTGTTRFSSLELGCEDSRTVGDCDSGYSCAYTNSLSWRTPQTPMPPEVNPRAAFERLFGTEDLSLDPETRAGAKPQGILRYGERGRGTSSRLSGLGPQDG